MILLYIQFLQMLSMNIAVLLIRMQKIRKVHDWKEEKHETNKY